MKAEQLNKKVVLSVFIIFLLLIYGLIKINSGPIRVKNISSLNCSKYILNENVEHISNVEAYRYQTFEYIKFTARKSFFMSLFKRYGVKKNLIRVNFSERKLPSTQEVIRENFYPQKNEVLLFEENPHNRRLRSPSTFYFEPIIDDTESGTIYIHWRINFSEH